MEIIVGIYKITSPSGKVYIGQSINIYKRFKRYNKLDCKGQSKLFRSLFKYHPENHFFEIIHECSVEELNIMERHYQDLYNVTGINGLNCVLIETDTKRRVIDKETIAKGVKYRTGRKQSEETIRKRIASRTGLKMTPEAMININLAAKRRIGIPLSEEHKRKIGEKGKGKFRSDETKLKMSIAQIGRKVSEETKLKLSVISSNMSEEHRNKIRQSKLGKTHSKETKNKMSKSHKGKFFSNERKHNMRLNHVKQVYCLETSYIYESVSDCARKNNFKIKTLHAKLGGQNRNNTSFVYYDELIHITL